MIEADHIFRPGWVYRAKVNFTLGGTFAAGELLTFKEDYYSIYDTASIYVFFGESGAEKEWLRRDNTPLNAWRDFFEEVGDPADGKPRK